MLFWSELVEGGAVLRQQVFLNAGIIACREHGSKQGSIPIPIPNPATLLSFLRNIGVLIYVGAPTCSDNFEMMSNVSCVKLHMNPAFVISS